MELLVRGRIPQDSYSSLRELGWGRGPRWPQAVRAVRAARLLLAHWRPLAVTDTRLAAVWREGPHTRGRQSATYTVCVLGTGPPWWPMSSIGLVVRGCTHRSLPVVWRGAGTYRWPPRAGGGSDRPEIPTPSARDFPGGDPTYPGLAIRGDSGRPGHKAGLATRHEGRSQVSSK